MTQDQRDFFDAMAVAILYATKNMPPAHTANLQRTYNKFCKDMGVPTPQQLANKILNNSGQHNFTLPEIDLTWQAVPNRWDDIEIEAIHMGKDHCEVVDDYDDEDLEINCYSVYLHNVSGGVQCIADCTSLAQAEALARLIEKAVENYIDNPANAKAQRRRSPKNN